MKNLFVLFISLCLSTVLLSAQDITGSWNGSLDIAGNELRIVFNIEKSGSAFSATMDSPDQGATGIPVDTVIFNDPVIKFSIKKIGFEYKGELGEDGAITGQMTQFGNSFPLNLSKGKVIIERPQEPKEPFSYLMEEVNFENPDDNIVLSGTLTLPQNTGPFPAIVLIAGSGPNNRDEEVFGHKPFLVLSDYLTKQGIVVLRYDKRGCGKSEGDYKSAITSDFASDAKYAGRYLAGRKEVDKNNIGFIGHSEGGIITFMLAANTPEIPFIVSLAGSSLKGDSVLMLQREAIYTAMGIPAESINQENALVRKAFKIAENANDEQTLKQQLSGLFDNLSSNPLYEQLAAQLSAPWMRSFLKDDPAIYLQNVRCPLLALNGDKDLQVLSKQNLGTIQRIVSPNGNKNLTIKEYPGLNHLFQSCRTGLPQEYGQIEETIDPLVLKDISEWILTIIK